MNISIRQATLADSAEIAGLLGQLGYASAAGDVQQRLQNMVRRADCYIAVAERAGSLCGVGAMHSYPAIHKDGLGCLITALVVSESVRGQGVGRLIVAELEKQARTMGCGRIMVTTANHRSGAHAFYESIGYTFTGRRYAKSLAE